MRHKWGNWVQELTWWKKWRHWVFIGNSYIKERKKDWGRYVNRFMIEEMTNHKRLHHNNQTIYLQTFDMKILKEIETYEKEKKVNNGIIWFFWYEKCYSKQFTWEKRKWRSYLKQRKNQERYEKETGKRNRTTQ